MNDQSIEKKIEHLGMIENIIERMGNNSFQLKGWTVSLVAVVGSLSSNGSDKRFFLLSFIPIFAFWFLDAFYLQIERKYKVLYKNVRQQSEENIDFDMDTQNIVCTGNDVDRICYCRCLFSKTEWPFYLIMALAVGGLALVLLLT